MLKKEQRLDRPSFSRYFNQGKRVHGVYTTIITSPSVEGFRSAVVVGKKVSKKAPERNSFRRRIYSMIEKVQKDQNLTGVCIVITKPNITKLTKRDFITNLTKEVGRALK